MASVCPTCMAEGKELLFEDPDAFHAHMTEHHAAPVRFVIDVLPEETVRAVTGAGLESRVSAIEGTLDTAVTALEAFQGRLIAQNFNIQGLIKDLREITHMLQDILNLLGRLGAAIEAIAVKLQLDPNALTGTQASQIRDALTSLAQRVEALLAGTPPPTLTATVSGLTATSAVLSWTTPEASDSQVEFGSTPAYGQSSPVDPTQTLTHSVTLSGLSPNAVYNYRVKSKTAAGVLRVSANATFNTPTA
jgi:hypothetical protein